ncbi:MAG TPA: cyclase family protein [Streptosporangiaceae bacterium]|jgi:kynurenine formamidase|nr:cyclase family protein [Streptosporangiaceae bacterium]
MEFIDLSQDIYQDMMVYPGHSKTALWQHATHEETSERFDGGFSFQTLAFTMNDNGPTHVDSFSHLDPGEGALTIDQMPLMMFYGPAVCLDVSHVPPRSDITADHLRAANEASAVPVSRGDIMLLHTADWNRHGGTRAYLTEFPGIGESGAGWIVSEGIKTFGVDSPTPDNPASRIYPCHMMCRRSGITHFENLANLDKVLNRRFTFAGFPLKLRGAHGGPTRAVAIIETDGA